MAMFAGMAAKSAASKVKGQHLVIAAAAIAGVIVLWQLAKRKSPEQKREEGEPGQDFTLAVINITSWDAPYMKQVNPGDTVGVNVSWKNNSTRAVAPSFRLGIKKPGLFESWLEGSGWTVASEVQPGETGVTRASVVIPSDWTNTAMSLKLDMAGVEGAVKEQRDAFITRAPEVSLSGLKVTYAGQSFGEF